MQLPASTLIPAMPEAHYVPSLVLSVFVGEMGMPLNMGRTFQDEWRGPSRRVDAKSTKPCHMFGKPK